MVQLARLLIVALLAVFSAWTVAQVAGATKMSLEMTTLAPVDDMGMSGCKDCDAGKMDQTGSVVCQSICAPAVLAELVGPDAIGSAPLVSVHVVMLVEVPRGQTYPPDPRPPRLILLV